MRATEAATCRACGQAYQALAYNVRRGRARYCGQACQARSVLPERVQNGASNPNWKGGVSQFPIRYTRTYKERHPERARAHNLLAYAVRVGRIVRPSSCPVCGVVGKVEAHHDDYGQPLSVSWLCRSCHLQRHRVIDSSWGRTRALDGMQAALSVVGEIARKAVQK